MDEKAQRIKDANTILKGEKKPFDFCFKLAKDLIGDDEFGLARRLLDRLKERGIDEHVKRTKVAQKRALATYKDPHLLRDAALDRAIAILEAAFNLSETRDTETLGLAGAIYKRKWEVDGARKWLWMSANFYRAGYQAWQAALEKAKQGESLSGIEQYDAEEGYYPAINAAFVLDLLASLERAQAEEVGVSSPTADANRKLAKEIRKHIIEALSAQFADKDAFGKYDYWPLVTLAEASLGLEKYKDTKAWLAKARKVPEIPEWEYVATAKQLVHLVQIQTGVTLQGPELEETEAWKALIDYLGDNATGLRSIFQGKIGLALSGGGFRASLYHIGVLAKLAELDLLRHIEVISCVSGGSIVGAQYYLELRRLFDISAGNKRHDEVTRDDYISLVKKLAKDFLVGVQENPRVQILANPFPNFKMLWSPTYSRTTRLGELYEELLYSKVEDGKQGEARWINDYVVKPPEQGENFRPRRDNWSRASKVPELVLNTTSLNSGHNWQFTATWMGESPIQIDEEVDTNTRFRRMYYQGDAPEDYRRVRLGTAVGASSCVPGLFEPVAFDGLYPDTMIRLVDGGVYDNQGIAGLIEQDCNVLIVSDATGQLNTEVDPGGGILKPLLRTNSTLMHRVRGSQYEDIKARKRASLIRSYAYIHLKKGLDGEAMNWEDCEELSEAPPRRDNPLTDYGIRKDIQALLAGVRTDLDSFSDIEAYALMTSGYRAMGQDAKCLQGIPMDSGPPSDWDFLKVEDGMTQNKHPMYKKLVQHLSVSPSLFLKVWKLHPVLRPLSWAAGAVLVAAFVYWWWNCPECKPLAGLFGFVSEKLSLNGIVMILLGLLIAYLATALLGSQQGNRLLAVLNYRDTLRRIGISLVAGPVGAIFAFVHLHVFDRMFQKLGRVE